MIIGGGEEYKNAKDVLLAKNYASLYPFVKYFSNSKNLGTFISRNNGAYQASGEYILFLDADDYLSLEACEILYSAISLHKAPDIVGFNFFKQENGKFSDNLQFIKYCVLSTMEFSLYLFKTKKSYWNLWNKAYKKSLYINAIETINIKDKVIVAEDVLMFLTLLLQAKNTCIIPQALYYYTQNPNSITNRTDSTKIALSITQHKLILSHISKLSNTQNRQKELICKIFYYDLSCSFLNEMRAKKSNIVFYVYSNIKKKILRFLRYIALKKYTNIM